MRNRLKPPDEDYLDKASSDGIIKQFNRIKEYNKQGRWLGPRNIYRLDPITKLKPDTKLKLKLKDFNPKYPRQLADYVAVSSPLHLWDGWNYLGLALYSCMCGYMDNAKHLAYYAELRAAMSLLASQGIGIFSNRHCVIDNNSKVYYMDKSGGTHQATWKYLEYWAKRDDMALSPLDRVFQFQSVPFADWLKVLPWTGAWAPLRTELLLSMGLDLERMTEDLDARNEASYRPTGLAVSQLVDVDFKADASFVVDAIRLLEPESSSGAFWNIDRYIFRRIIKRALETGGGGTQRFQNSVTQMVSEFVDNPELQKELEDFLTRRSDEIEPQLIREAGNREGQYDAKYHLQIISRAMLLLRVATGMVREVLNGSNISLESLKFWWCDAGKLQGFWDIPSQSIDGSQLWADLNVCLDDISDWITDNDNDSRRSLTIDCASPLTQITGMARFALIGLGL